MFSDIFAFLDAVSDSCLTKQMIAVGAGGIVIGWMSSKYFWGFVGAVLFSICGWIRRKTDERCQRKKRKKMLELNVRWSPNMDFMIGTDPEKGNPVPLCPECFERDFAQIALQQSAHRFNLVFYCPLCGFTHEVKY